MKFLDDFYKVIKFDGTMLKSICIGITLLSSLSSCVNIPLSSESEDVEAKKFIVPVGQSTIYVFRNEYYGGSHKFGITIDSKLVAQSAPFTYFKWDVEPGRHLVSCRDGENRTVEVFTKVGKVTFVKQEVFMSTSGLGCTVYEVSDEDGRAGVGASKLGKSVPP